MDVGKFKFVFFFIVEEDAVFVEEAHNGGFPAGRAEEANNHVEKPVLFAGL